MLSDDELVNAGAAIGWKWVPVEPTPEMLSAVGMMDGYDWHAPGCSPDADHANWYSAMIAAAPAASQAEPHRNQPLRDLLAVIHCDGGHHTEAVGIEQSIKDALSAVYVLKGKLAQAEPRVVASFYTEDAELVGTTHAPIKRVEVEDDGTLHVFIDHWPQAEPKREPLSDEQIDVALQTDPAMILALMSGEMTVGEFKSALRRLARAVERAAYERAAQVCIETAAELRRCADGCTDGRYDWKADGALDCADAIRALGRQ